MEKSYLTYDVSQGSIDHWLILGPLEYPLDLPKGEDKTELDFRRSALVSFSPDRPLSDQPPTQLDKVIQGRKESFWKLEHCKSDHRVEVSWFSEKWEYSQLWAYSCCLSPFQRQCSVELKTVSPSSIWLNGKIIFRTEAFYSLGTLDERSYSIDLPLLEGENHLWLLLEDASIGNTTLSAQFQFKDDVPLRKVAIPVLSNDLDYWKTIEGIYAKLSLNRAIYGSTDTLVLHCPKGLPLKPHATLRIRTPSGRIYGEFSRELASGDISLGIGGNHLPPGELEVMVMPPLDDYYQKHFRVSRSIPFQVTKDPFYDQEVVPYEMRLTNVLQAAVGSENLVSEYAKLKITRDYEIDPNVIQLAIQRIQAEEIGSLRDALGLLAIALQLSAQQRPLPDAIDKLLKDGSWYGSGKLSPYHIEAEQLCDSACQILSGQLYSDTVLARSGLSGKELQYHGEQHALEWLQQHAWYGFHDWNPNLDELIPVLVILTDFAKNEQIRELAAVLLDKQIYLLALTSWKGCSLPIGSKVSALHLKSEQLHSHAPLGMLLWGQGNNHQQSDGAAYLALAESYSAPDIIRSIAQDQNAILWAAQKDAPIGSSSEAVTQVLYKTPEYLLASAQHPAYGQAGQWEHLWQATLGTEAVVYTNLPGSYSQSDFRPRGYWRGNAVMPRLAQWQDSLICIYYSQAPNSLGFTHAYFPLYAFDEYRIEKQWAFARKQDAYIALYAYNSLELMTEGVDAYRELRSEGEKNIWCCQMGRRSQDHSFNDFCRKVSGSEPEINDSLINWRTVRDQEIVFGWEEDFKINGKAVQLLVNKQLDSKFGQAPMPAYTMDIINQGDILRLDFS